VWLLLAQLPRWTAPQSGWFAPETPAVCAAVASLAVYQAQRSDPQNGIGRDAAQSRAKAIAAEHYGDLPPDVPLDVSEPLAVQAALPGDPRSAYYVVTVRLRDETPEKAAIIYLDAATGDPRALITATEEPAADCDFDIRAALVVALKSAPSILLVAYILIAAGALVARRLLNARGKSG